MNVFNSSLPVGEIVAIMPKAGEIFKEFHIDFCCGGDRALSEVLKEQNLDEVDIMNRLTDAMEETEKLNNRDIDFRELTSSRLIDYIVSSHHAYTKKVLPEIGELTVKILRVHGRNHGEVLAKVHRLFSSLKSELEQHLIKEEEILFPMIKEYDSKPSNKLLVEIQKVMGETENEHGAAGDILKELRRITENYSVPEDGCTTYRMTFNKLVELESDLFLHIHLENNILFKNLALKS